MEIRGVEVEERRIWLFGTLGFLLLAALYTFSSVFWTVLFSLSAVYMLYPLRRRLVSRGFSERRASFLVTLGAFAALVILVVPFVFFGYQRIGVLTSFISELPAKLNLDVLGTNYTLDTSTLIEMARQRLSDTAVKIASALPSVALKSFLSLFVVFGVLYRPEAVVKYIMAVPPDSMTENVRGFHRRIRETLYGIYVVQAATATVTFLFSLPVFYFLGYEPFFALALFAGLLQFIPVLGPSLMIVGISAVDLLLGNVVRAFLNFTIGLIVIGALPDVILRPWLANKTMGQPALLYFLGFIGGVLTFGAAGVIVGPLVTALVLETLEQISEI